MQTPTAEIGLKDEGIVYVRIRPEAKQGLDQAKENMGAAIAAGAGVKRPLLTDIRGCQPLTPEARRYYSGQALIDAFSAMALLIDASPFDRMMGNVYLSIARPGVPTRLFNDEKAALGWLREYVGVR